MLYLFGIATMVTGFMAWLVALCTHDEQRRRGVMFEGFKAVGLVGARNNNHAYIEFDTPTYYKYTKQMGWVVVGFEHMIVASRPKVYAHLTKPQKVAADPEA